MTPNASNHHQNYHPPKGGPSEGQTTGPHHQARVRRVQTAVVTSSTTTRTRPTRPNHHHSTTTHTHPTITKTTTHSRVDPLKAKRGGRIIRNVSDVFKPPRHLFNHPTNPSDASEPPPLECVQRVPHHHNI